MKNSYTKVTAVVIDDEYDLNIDVLENGSPTATMWGTIDECKEKCDTFDECEGFQHSSSSWKDGKWGYWCRFKSMNINPGSNEECDRFDIENCSEYASVSYTHTSYQKVPNFVTSTDDNVR